MATVRWHTREDSGLRLDREQRWFHDDERIEHPKVIEAFNRGLRVEDDADPPYETRQRASQVNTTVPAGGFQLSAGLGSSASASAGAAFLASAGGGLSGWAASRSLG